MKKSYPEANVYASPHLLCANVTVVPPPPQGAEERRGCLGWLLAETDVKIFRNLMHYQNIIVRTLQGAVMILCKDKNLRLISLISKKVKIS
jgi:hypothetical protein